MRTATAGGSAENRAGIEDLRSALRHSDSAWRRMARAAELEYRVPRRLPLVGILSLLTLVAVTLAALRVLHAPEQLTIFLLTLIMVVVAGQMRVPRLPRRVSMGLGIAVLGLWVGGYDLLGISFLPPATFLNVQGVAVLLATGALAGYAVGTLAAGVFLVLNIMASRHAVH